jgi:glycosyltransferase involved in cell wall biosynthesis
MHFFKGLLMEQTNARASPLACAEASVDSQFKSVALLYDDSAYVEVTQRATSVAPDAPVGLVGRQVAGREFLDAFLGHGSWTELTAVVYNQTSADSLLRFCEQHPSSRTRQRGLRVVQVDQFTESFCPNPPAPLLYSPCPPDPSFAWARQHASAGAFAMSGVTHTLCTAGAARVLCELVTAPYEPYDALICTSNSVADMVRAVTGAYIDYLRERHGGTPTLRPRLETIPLGVNPERFRPATAAERASQRAALKIADDEVAVLFVGRFAPHGKAHPFPMFHGLAEAARRTGRKTRLILAGWAAHPSLMQAYLDAARSFAPGVAISAVDGMDPAQRFAVWHAADLFTSLADSIQETFGLVVIEAMASGLPVVASDWDGYRDLVANDETGFLVPTQLVHGATANATVRLLLDGVDYDGFLAECNQTAIVDPAAAAAAYARLLNDDALRRRMGAAGRQRVLERFTWAGVIRAYEELWRDQDRERREWVARKTPVSLRSLGPPCYPAPEVSFAGYPSHLLQADVQLEATPDAGARLQTFLAHPLTHYAQEWRVADADSLRILLETAKRPAALSELDAVLRSRGISFGRGRATVAWLLKYGLLRLCW